MTGFRDLSIRHKVSALTLIIVGTVLVIATATYLIGSYVLNSRAIGEDLATTAKIIAHNSVAALAFDDGVAAERTLQSLAAKTDIESATLLDTRGRVLAIYPPGHLGALPAAPKEMVPFRSGDGLSIAVPVMLDGERIGTLAIATSLRTLHAHLRVQGLVAGIVVVMAFGFAAAVSMRAQRHISAPIVKLVEAMKKVSSTRDYAVRLDRSGGDEIGQLSDGFNRMLAEIESRERELSTARHEAESANRAKSAFLANMSHELRTPLNAIIGFSELITEAAFGPIAQPKYREYAEDIHQSGKHLLEIINSILDLSKVEAGKIELVETNLEIERVVAKTLRLFRQRVVELGLELSSAFAPGSPHLFADERIINQCLLNLVSNALKFTPAGGRCHVSVERALDGGLTIAVSDTGIGIAAKDIETALSPFGQVENALSRKFEGTGLGLPIVKTFVELHDGRLRLDSEVGKGTTVSLDFPASRVRERVAITAAAAG